MSTANAFRGIKGIQEIVTRMTALVDYYERFRPDVKDLVCERKDYDLIARWPRAANVEGFLVSDNGIYFKGLRLTYDTGQGRYDKAQTPEQSVIT